MDELVEALGRAVKWLDRYRNQPRAVGEQNTKAGLIEPLLAALGWDIHDPDEVYREYRRVTTDNPVDYALLLLRTPRLFVEAKGVNENLDDPRWANQTVAYATAAGVEWVVLTNGAEWRILNAHAPVPIEQKLFQGVRIVDQDEALRILPLLSKDNAGENRIAALWKIHFVDRQVKEVLVELFGGGEPPRELINAVRRRVPTLAVREVRESLGRARATFEFPVLEDIAVPASQRPGTVRRVSAQGRSKQPISAPASGLPAVSPKSGSPVAPRAGLSLRDLIELGRLAVGDELEAPCWNELHVATLAADGTLNYRGRPYRSLSTAGEAVKVAIRGDGLPISLLSTNGWVFWSANDRATKSRRSAPPFRAVVKRRSGRQAGRCCCSMY